MSTLEEQIDIDVPMDVAWDSLHRMETYPRFVDGVRGARSEDGIRTSLDVETGGRLRQFEAEITDRAKENVMAWQTTSGPDLAGTFSLLPIDRGTPGSRLGSSTTRTPSRRHSAVRRASPRRPLSKGSYAMTWSTSRN